MARTDLLKGHVKNRAKIKQMQSWQETLHSTPSCIIQVRQNEAALNYKHSNCIMKIYFEEVQI